MSVKYGMWTVIDEAVISIKRHNHMLCRCSCGTERHVRCSALSGSTSESCGCVRLGKVKHGLSHHRSEYMIWALIKQRCHNENHTSYPYYGGRGISVCLQWRDSFEDFFNDMGPRPSSQHEIDRRNNNGNYTSGNCRWILHVTNGRNTRVSKWWFVDGTRYDSMRHAAGELGVNAATIKAWCDGYRMYLPKENCWSELKYQ